MAVDPSTAQIWVQSFAATGAVIAAGLAAVSAQASSSASKSMKKDLEDERLHRGQEQLRVVAEKVEGLQHSLGSQGVWAAKMGLELTAAMTPFDLPQTLRLTKLPNLQPIDFDAAVEEVVRRSRELGWPQK